MFSLLLQIDFTQAKRRFQIKFSNTKICCSLPIIFFLAGCSTHNKEVLIGGVVGSAVGAGAGHAFVHHGRGKQYQTRNTIITSVVFGVLTAGALALHYRALKQKELEVSGQFSRYKLCKEGSETTFREDPQEQVESLKFIDSSSERILSLKLDESTRWVTPKFRKRELPSTQSKDEAVAAHYRWEIVQPGYFVTRDRSPGFFLEVKGSIEEEPRKDSK